MQIFCDSFDMMQFYADLMILYDCHWLFRFCAILCNFLQFLYFYADFIQSLCRVFTYFKQFFRDLCFLCIFKFIQIAKIMQSSWKLFNRCTPLSLHSVCLLNDPQLAARSCKASHDCLAFCISNPAAPAGLSDSLHIAVPFTEADTYQRGNIATSVAGLVTGLLLITFHHKVN